MMGPLVHRFANCLAACVAFALSAAFSAPAQAHHKGAQIGAKAESPTPAVLTNDRPNIIFVLTDDHRFDAIGALDPNLDTPHMDRMMREGAYFPNAFVTTSLCSPSRASILTGQRMRTHRVVDNNTTDLSHLEFFPQRLQRAGYQTAFVGKWHMGGHSDAPQPGFDRWVSFAGQGNYLPVSDDGVQSWLNVDGRRVRQRGYITDELQEYALGWLEAIDRSRPFMLYLSHKAVHAEFIPAQRHANQYADRLPGLPASASAKSEHREGRPMWVHNQRNSWHGIDFPYHSALDIRQYRREYNRSLSAVDEGLGQLFAWLEVEGLAEDTIVVLMGDNGFMFGEHGLIDKRNAYEESMRVPLLIYAPGRIGPGTVIEELVANIDIAPTMLAWAGLDAPDHYEGASMAELIAQGGDPNWRDTLVYEYFWEYNFPHTPTTFAIRTPRYKLIQYHGVWDIEELYDIAQDPQEMNNLIDHPALVDVKMELRRALFEGLQNDSGENLLRYTVRDSSGAVFRHRDRSPAAPFHERWLRGDNAPDRLQQFTPDSPEKLEKFGPITNPMTAE